MIKRKNIFAVVLLFLFVPICLAQSSGNLFIIGGGSIPEYLINKYVEIAGGKDEVIVIIPMASAEPEKGAEAFEKKLQKAGCKNIKTAIFNKESADSDSIIGKFTNAHGVFFTGGDQSKLTKVLIGTKLFEIIKRIYQDGGVIGGTSAGAAVMTDVMLTGEERLNKDSSNAYSSIKKSNIVTAKGFGFLKRAIVDQHFVKRKRMNRLFSITMENPALIGIGIDESTAIIAKPDDTFEVLGDGTVVIIDATNAKNISTSDSNNLTGENMIVHILKTGDSFNNTSHKVTFGSNLK